MGTKKKKKKKHTERGSLVGCRPTCLVECSARKALRPVNRQEGARVKDALGKEEIGKKGGGRWQRPSLATEKGTRRKKKLYWE